MRDPDSTWVCGGFGALAEFHFDTNEEVAFTEGDTLGAATARGAFHLVVVAELRPVAYETMSKTGKGWGQGLVLCLPRKMARMGERTVITELGPDMEAIRPQDRGAILFDLGIGKPQSDICVRTADPRTLALLRAACGKPLFGHGHDLAMQMPVLSPHRVFRSRVARVEVYQPVPPPDGKTPDGPHTHVRPQPGEAPAQPRRDCAGPAGLVAGAVAVSAASPAACIGRRDVLRQKPLRRVPGIVAALRRSEKHFPARPRQVRQLCRRVLLDWAFESLNANPRYGNSTALDDLHTHCHKFGSGSRKGSKGNADNPRLPPQL